MNICIDFDGTCVAHAFPNIGADIGAIPVLKKIVNSGHNLILFTMRSDVENVPSPEFEGTFTGTYLTDAIKWFNDNDIPLYGIQTNPTQHEWTTSPKAYGDLYIDDCGLGIPLMYNSELSDRAFVDWEETERILKRNKIL